MYHSFATTKHHFLQTTEQGHFLIAEPRKSLVTLSARKEMIYQQISTPNIFTDTGNNDKGENTFTLSSSRSGPFAHYTVIDDIEQGSNSIVKHCVDDSDHHVILKAIKAYDNNPLNQLITEIAYQQIASDVAPKIIRYGVGNIIFNLPSFEFLGTEMLFIMMEYRGITLGKYLSLFPSDYADIRTSVHSAVASMLANGLKPLDISAANVVVDQSKHACLIDFDPNNTTYDPKTRQQLVTWAKGRAKKDVNGNSPSHDILRSMYNSVYVEIEEMLQPYNTMISK